MKHFVVTLTISFNHWKKSLENTMKYSFCFASCKFFSAIEKCYYVSILLKMFLGTAKIFHNKPIKDNNSSITM